MQEKSSDPKTYFQMKRISQITDSHCGPAVVQMLLSNLGVDATQEEIALAAGVQDVIEMHGTRVDQLAAAVKRMAPNLQFWYKDHATLDDVLALVSQYHYPVGVEWQGVFEDEGEEDPEPDYGHYSVITHVDRDKGVLVIVDPYRDYVLQDRVFRLDEFDERWWDFNMAPNPVTGKEQLVEDYHMLFIVTPKEAYFPAEMGLKKA
jgi:peptidase C39-like protein